ncbi:pyruvate dehydrogenase complex E1 component subunit beta [Parvibaculum sp.]|jgi:pyruvate dehydrogenase E1 component beta subunit|uniref:pyruvate dehydrogenase complex E1 component subunit beta n=1 Tax=Parvibaculum sp. TaxID=2024848 RepID=UPI001B227E31|nr:pyruvate dehydrogenase complex E1 component subunit beta [Parvibaculum sp.]MBO6635542.1 pyruvate dehydrogenase complex E1 component subunit beta [Parvibaculum sp.]MBO6680399.1 pyruvate dehydrogenase complex E1 component subunit beta [Parvibaculum sp.]MBO6685950.1 pyruvate dehydrogenase complex E1 component subunit beta [Parvibaculum sp.]MBO6905528.1 pyruvate dehydrogenase complex E1 component subunit beta [Parvibaculum sp.]
MSIEVLMPALSPTMEEGTLTKWHVKVGDEVKSGDVIAEIETDKATMEVEAADEGTVARILVDEGTENVQVNAVIALLAGEDEDVSDVKSEAPKEKTKETPKTDAGQGEKTSRESGEKAKKETAEPKVEVQSDPDIPEGTEYATQTVREALRDAMAEEMRRDETVFVMGEEVAQYEGAYKVTQGLLAEFGDKRVVDTPITEHGFAGLGVGAAMAGLRPIVEFMTFNFAMQAIDQIINSAAKTRYMSGGQMSCPIVFRGPNGPAARVGAQHSQDYASWYAHIPGLIVIAPYSAADAKGLLKAAIRDPNPVIFLENEVLYGKSFEVPKLEDHVLPIGKARVMKEGSDVTLVSHSHGITYCLEAMATLEEEGLDVELIDLRTIRPLDMDTVVASVKKTNRLVTVEETWPVCGIGAEIAAEVQARAFDYLDAPILRVAQKNVPMPYAANLEKLALPSAAEVVEAVKTVCYR